MTEENLDAQLVSRAQDGDKLAFELLVRKYQHRIVQLVSRLVGEADAPDVAQEALIKAYRALNGFRGQSAFYTWLYRIAINTAKNSLVSRGRRPASQDIDISEAELYGHTEQLSDVDTPEDMVLTEELKQKVAEAIQSLPDDLRRAITLRELEGLSYEEIAGVMECPIGTVRSRIFRAREAIDAVVRPLMEGGIGAR
ncbi:MAG TPA: RNA polymerase sigma factor RpoE [Nevskiaceae bacterium]